MTQLIRHLIIWIVAALLPLQGYAAAAMISCGPMHAQAATQFHGDLGHEAHDTSHHGHHGAAAEAQDSADHAQPVLPDLLKFKCSACAACCTGALAVSYLAPISGVVRTPPDVIPYFASLEDGIVIDALERPPRTFLA